MEALVSSDGGGVETRVEAGRRRWLASSQARRNVTSRRSAPTTFDIGA
jgi:hypothetical protein